MTPRIAAIVPTYNEEDIIYWTIRYLVDQDIYVHVLDNESTDSTLEIIEKFPKSQVSFSSFSTNNTFDEREQGENIRRVIHELGKNYEWLMRNDADEYIESPFRAMSLSEGIKLADSQGFNAIGTTLFQFYPMSDESPHIAGDDVRRCYDYFNIWEGETRFEIETYPEPNKLWKTNVFKYRSGLSYGNSHKPEPLSEVKLFPYLFILRHYPFREPERTRRKIITERRDRLSRWMLENKVGEKYLSFPENATYLFDRLKKGTSHRFGSVKIEGGLNKWSTFTKPCLENIT